MSWWQANHFFPTENEWDQKQFEYVVMGHMKLKVAYFGWDNDAVDQLISKNIQSYSKRQQHPCKLLQKSLAGFYFFTYYISGSETVGHAPPR